ncbi:hypothetical protein BT63DRAFT_441574 [Microthyrium microscopicum]|uniref:ferric-chelate reductase (NADPH) n=1 Tax=Microthyrium microscopicum TaxID=703497 RepID=A0A6A6U746_9PEZI|nr:hypothetical protein BT63DRAFT_441574 [Microthyrium microscopicum]
MDGFSQYANLSGNPLWDLSENDPRCINVSCLAYILGYLDDQDRYSNDNYPLYAYWTTYFYCATVALFAIVYVNRRLRDGGAGSRFKEQAKAYWRMWIYRRITGKLGEQMDMSLGQLTIFIIATIFILVLPFAQGYFLRAYFRFGSPPLSVRCAMLISGLLPICIALAGKVNIVSCLTGISYAKLNVWHRYIALMIYILTIIHLVPHVIAPIREGGDIEFKDLLQEGRRERSGIILEVSFTLMLATSFPYFRNRFYEAFKFLHVFFAVAFFAFLTWHVTGEYLTPDFLWASVAILIGNFIARAVYRNRTTTSFNEFVQGYPTSLEILPGKMTRIVVQCPNKLRWRPGQHCYISIPGISKLQSHPFTIVSLSTPYLSAGPNDLVILMRAYSGFTKAVADLAKTPALNITNQPPKPSMPNTPSHSYSSSFPGTPNQSYSPSFPGTPDTSLTIAPSFNLPVELTMATRAWIDGPYGDFHPALERQYHGITLVGGGSGITAGLPWLVYIASRMRTAAHGLKGLHGEKLCKTRTLHLIWSIRDLDWIRWADRELTEALRDVMIANTQPQRNADGEKGRAFKLQISLFVTKSPTKAEMKTAVIDLYLRAGVDIYNPHARVEIRTGRPNYAGLLPNMLDRKRNMILTCGPVSQKIDLANSVAQLQSMVIQDQAMEISLHSETFGW